MKRYYLSKIFQNDGTFNSPPGAWMHKLQTYANLDFVAGDIATDPETGVPTQKAVLCLVGGINHKRLQGDPDVVPMPQVAHDMKVSAIHTKTKLDAKAAVKALGFADAEVDDVWGNADGMRDILNHYGNLNQADFDCNDFDLDES